MARYSKHALEAAVVHDWLYAKRPFDKETADKIFLAFMEQAGVPAWRRFLMYKAVDWFGGKAYRT